MVEVNGTDQEVEEPPLTEEVPDPRAVEADELLEELRAQVDAAKTARATVAKELADAEQERAKLSELRTEAEAALERAEAVEEHAAAAQEKATTAATQAQKSSAAAQKHAQSISATNDTVNTTLGSVNTNAETIAEHRAQVEEDAEATARLAKKSEAVESRVKEYEDGFDERNSRADELANQVENLLPGATSAGLAHSFRESKESKERPRRFWLGLFIGSVALILTSLFVSLPYFSDPTDFEGISWLYLLGRLPVVLPLMLLAGVALVYFRIESRIQEDYRHKENLAASYEGFRSQMSKEKAADKSSPASYDLAMKTLDVVHAPPGRMFDKKGDSHTPVDALAKTVVDGVVQGLKLSTPD